MEAKKFEMELGGRTFSIEVGRLARQANGAAMVRYGDTVTLSAATASKQPRQGIDFFPLTVDREERLYAVGRIPGGFIKREGRPTEKGILICRLTDRPIRPLFPKGFRNDVQVVNSALSVDHDNPLEVCVMNGASAALSVSDIPFAGPVGAVIVGLVNDQFVVNPTLKQAEESLLHLTVAGTKDAVLMIEAGAKEVPEETILDAIMFGHRHIVQLVQFQEEIARAVGKPKLEVPIFRPEAELEAAVREAATEPLRRAMRNPDKLAREEDVERVKAEVKERLGEVYPDREREIGQVLHEILKHEVRRDILERGTRPDGRGPKEIRPISVEVGVLPRTHGTGLFTRGQTQALTVCTLGTVSDVQVLDGLGVEQFKRYIHHYSFPPFSTGETKPMRGPSRRDIGHGALAERALLPMIPTVEEFPYTLRLVSEILESNGSSSMASVCGSTLALMDAGVPIKAPVAGVAMGLVKEEDGAAILTDIQGIEDALGDMDFKVAGTRAGVTAIQMDMKIAGIDRELLSRALAQAREGRLFILDQMLEVIDAPRREMSPYAPRIIVTHVPPDKIREVIGPGGKTINHIIEASQVDDKKVEIDIEDDGTIYIACANAAAAQKALQMIEDLTRPVEVGGVYTGRVTRVTNFGAFVEIAPGKEGLVHISQLARERVGRVEDVVNVGDEVTVKVTEIDRMNRINLSRKDLLPPGEPAVAPARRE